jgi:uncharacterized protein (TIGR04255 family)
MAKKIENYPNAPIALVALEVRHPKAEPLIPAERREIKLRLAAQTPIPRPGQSMQITGMLQLAVEPAPASESNTEEFPRYFSRDNTLAVALRAESIIIETTRYETWEKLRNFAAIVFDARQQVAKVDGVQRVGLRYINEVRAPHGTHSDDAPPDWAPWVDASLLGPHSIGQRLNLTPQSHVGGTVFASGPQQATVLRSGTHVGYAVSPEGELRRSIPRPGPFFLLDMDSFWTPKDETPEFDPHGLLTTCDSLHAPMGSLFESLITDRLRKEVLRRDS